MSATVYATAGGRKYHYTQYCSSLVSAQLLSDWDCGEDWCGGQHIHPVMHAIKPMSTLEAALQGKLPCLACVPEFLRTFQVRDFGHKPVMAFTDRLGRGLGLVCGRCRTRRRVELADNFDAARLSWSTVSVQWPCTSATVLGIVRRREPLHGTTHT